MTTVLDEALRLHDAGYAVLPLKLDGSKSPDLWTWTRYKTERPNEAEIRYWFRGPLVGLGVIGGTISGGLVCLDFDDHGGNLGETFSAWCQAIPADLLDKLVTYRTPKNGWRVCWRQNRCPTIAKYKLAMSSKKDCIIEELVNQIIVVPGGHPDVHQTRLPYLYTQGHLADVSTLTDYDDIEVLIFSACELGKWKKPKPKPKSTSQRPASTARTTVGDDFNRRGSWEEALPGWTLDYSRGNVGYWCRPGKNRGASATTDYHDGLFFVFSSNAGIEAKGYSRFAAFAAIAHGGDFKAAAAELRKRGYGGPVLTAKQKEFLRSIETPKPACGGL